MNPSNFTFHCLIVIGNTIFQILDDTFFDLTQVCNIKIAQRLVIGNHQFLKDTCYC